MLQSNDKTEFEAINGWFIYFTPEQSKLVREALEEDGYTADHEGLKTWILDNCTDTDNPDVEDIRARAREYHAGGKSNPVVAKMLDYLAEHPEALEGARRTLQGAMGHLMRKVKI